MNHQKKHYSSVSYSFPPVLNRKKKKAYFSCFGENPLEKVINESYFLRRMCPYPFETGNWRLKIKRLNVYQGVRGTVLGFYGMLPKTG